MSNKTKEKVVIKESRKNVSSLNKNNSCLDGANTVQIFLFFLETYLLLANFIVGQF